MKTLFYGILATILTINILPAQAQMGGYDPLRSTTSTSTSVQTTSQTTPQQPAGGGGKEQQIKNLLAINGLTPIQCGFGVAKLIFPGLGEVCITSQPGKFESGATYQFDASSNTINRVGAAVVNNGGGGTTIPTSTQPVVVPIPQNSSSGGTIAPMQSDSEFALATLAKNGLQVSVCEPSTAQFFISGKLVGCATATSAYPAGKYNISR